MEIESLIVQAKTDRGAMNGALVQIDRKLWKMARRHCHGTNIDPFEAHGLALRTAAKVILSWDKDSGVPFLIYLHICVRRAFCRSMPRGGRIRKRKRPAEKSLEGSFVAVTDRVISESKRQLAISYTRAQVNEILEKIPRPLAELIRAAYGIGAERKSKTQIASENGVARQTQQDRINRALEEFKKKWEEGRILAETT